MSEASVEVKLTRVDRSACDEHDILLISVRIQGSSHNV